MPRLAIIFGVMLFSVQLLACKPKSQLSPAGAAPETRSGPEENATTTNEVAGNSTSAVENSPLQPPMGENAAGQQAVLTHVEGPFLPDLVNHCLNNGGGVKCDAPRWDMAFFENHRNGLFLAYCRSSSDPKIRRTIEAIGPETQLTGVPATTQSSSDDCQSKLDLLASREQISFFTDAIEDLRPLALFPQLTSLQVAASTKVVDLSPIQFLTRLDFLGISHSGVADLKPLAKLKNLRALDISGTQVTDFTPLAQFPSLTALTLDELGIKDLTPLIPTLSQLKELTILSLRGNAITNLQPLAQLPAQIRERLESLALDENQISEASLATIELFTGLESLDLSANPLTNAQTLAKTVAKLPKLTQLSLGSLKLEDPNPLLKVLQSISKLESLHLPNNGLNDSHLELLESLKNLQNADFSRNAIQKKRCPTTDPDGTICDFDDEK